MTDMQAHRTTEHLRWLDTMRGLAACSVVLFHLNEPREYALTWYQWTVKHGWLGVPCFFVISGLSVQLAAHRNPKVRNFLIKRFWRIYPPYVASLAVCLMSIALLHYSVGQNDVARLPRTLFGLGATALVATYPVTNVPSMNWVYWSLSYEIVFYLIVAVSLALAPRYRWTLFTGLSIVAFFFKTPEGARLVYAWPLDQWCLFAIGLCIAEWQTTRHPAALLVAALASCDLVFNRPAAVAIIGLSTAITALICMSKHGHFLNKEKIISTLGVWSYGLYLIHVPIGVWILLRFTGSVTNNSLTYHIASDLFILSTLLGFSIIFYHIIEKPSRQIGMAMTLRRHKDLLRRSAPRDSTRQLGSL